MRIVCRYDFLNRHRKFGNNDVEWLNKPSVILIISYVTQMNSMTLPIKICNG